MTDKEAMKLALDAFEDTHYRIISAGLLDQDLLNRNFTAATALRERLAQPEQKPDVIMHWESHTWTTNNPPPKGSGDVGLCYTPPQRTWVGLTDEEKNDCLVSADPCETLAEPEARQLIEDVEQALKEKNNG